MISGAKNFSAFYRNIAAEGDAVLKLADGSTVTFLDVAKAQLAYDDFLLV